MNTDFNSLEELLADNYIGFGLSANDSINKYQAVNNWKENVVSRFRIS